MRGELQKLAALMLVTALIVITVAVLGPRLLGAAGGPEGELITTLKKAERTGLELTIAPYGVLQGTDLQYQRLSVTLEPDRAVVTGTLDFTGAFAPIGASGEARTKVSSLGLERIVFVRHGGDWVAERGLAPRLSSIVRALEQRRRALDEAAREVPDAGEALPVLTRGRYRAEAWYIRSEREGVEVAEDYRLTVDRADRPVDQRATSRFSLTEDRAGSFVAFDGG